MLLPSAICSILLLSCRHVLVKGDAASDLASVQDAFFRWELQQAPLFSTFVLAENSLYNDRLTNFSLKALDEQFSALKGFLDTARAIDRGELGRQQQYMYDIFVDALTTFLNNSAWKYYGPANPISSMEAFYLQLERLLEITPFENKTDFDNFISRLEAWPTQVDQMIERMDKAILMGTTHHNLSVEEVPEQISQLLLTPVKDSPLYKPFTDALVRAHLPRPLMEDLKTRAEAAIERVYTSLRALKTYFLDTYMPHTRQTYGVYGLPSGREYYRACLKWHLSVDMAPEDVHRTGLGEVDRITQRLRKIMTKKGFNGTVAEFFHYMNTAIYYDLSSEAGIIGGYENLICCRIKPILPLLFKDIPRSPIERSYMLAAVAMHEAMPGNHFQYTFLQRNEDSPNFQRHPNIEYFPVPYKLSLNSAYTEGWAVYSEYLGEEVDYYVPNLEVIGRYASELLRASHLVVDTGLHYYEWTQEMAVQYLKNHTHISMPLIEMEVKRYLTWPGQACAGKIGELKIKELRQKATKDLGSKFDLRDFHSLILKSGPVPLRVLEAIVNDYIHVQNNPPSGRAPCIRGLSSAGLLLFLASWLCVLWHH